MFSFGVVLRLLLSFWCLKMRGLCVYIFVIYLKLKNEGFVCSFNLFVIFQYQIYFYFLVIGNDKRLRVG